MKLIEKIFYHSSNKVLKNTIMKIILVLKIVNTNDILLLLKIYFIKLIHHTFLFLANHF